MSTEPESWPVGGTEYVSRTWVIVAWAIVALLLLALLIVGWRYYSLRADIERACQPESVVARLDLTEWVPLCR